jgi:hypothetical protein
MKTKNWTPRIETLEDRNMLSATPLGEIVAPAPEPAHIGMLLPAVQKVRAAEARMIASEVDPGDAATQDMSRHLHVPAKHSFQDISFDSRPGGGVLKVKLSDSLVTSFLSGADGQDEARAVLYGRKAGDDKRQDY